jgi:hypothetical protein
MIETLLGIAFALEAVVIYNLIIRLRRIEQLYDLLTHQVNGIGMGISTATRELREHYNNDHLHKG